MILAAPWEEHGQRLLFRALIDAWAHPGRIIDVSPWCGDGPALVAVLATLCDAAASLCDVHGTIAPADRSRLGALPADPALAMFVVAEAGRPVDGLRPQVGTLLEPQRGATLVLTCQALGTGDAVRLCGPGVAGTETVTFTGVDASWWSARTTWCAFPCGVDLVLCDRQQVVCIPRSTLVEH